MCAHGETENVVIMGRKCRIDKCIAPIVRALNEGGILTAMSCCGHGEGDGFILIYHQNKYRLLIVLEEGERSLKHFDQVCRPMAEMFDNRRMKNESKSAS